MTGRAKKKRKEEKIGTKVCKYAACSKSRKESVPEKEKDIEEIGNRVRKIETTY